MFGGNEDQEMPSESDWANARRLYIFLEHFYELTLRVSGSLYETSNIFLHELSNVACKLIDKQESGDLKSSKIALKMQEKFDKYWKKSNKLIYIVVLLDPRYKEQYI